MMGLFSTHNFITAADYARAGLCPKLGALIQAIPNRILGGTMLVYGMIVLMGVCIWMDAKADFTRHKNLAVAGASLMLSFRVLSWPAQLTEKPRSRKVPFSVHRAQGNPEHLRGLFGGETGKEPELHKPALAIIQLSQRHERFIESNDIRAAISRIVCRRERNQNRRASAVSG